MVKNPPPKAGDARDAGLIPGLGRSPEGGNGNLFQYSCLENFMDRGTWLLTVHGPQGVGTVIEWLRTCTSREKRGLWVSGDVTELMNWPTVKWPHGLYSPWNSPGQNMEWVAFPFSRGSSQPRDQTQVSHIAGGFFTSWATREALESPWETINVIIVE